jgi:hypothetical protein
MPRLCDLLQRGAIDALPSCLGECGRKVTLSVNLRLQRCRGATTLIVPARVTQACPSRPDPALIKALVRAHQWFEQLRSGQASSIRHLALTEGLTERYVARILQLAFLAPDIQEATLQGTQPPDLTIEHLRSPIPLTWSEQRRCMASDKSKARYVQATHRRSPTLMRRRSAPPSINRCRRHERQPALLASRPASRRSRARSRLYPERSTPGVAVRPSASNSA